MNKLGFGKTLSEIEFAALKKGKHQGFNAAYELYADHVYSLCIHIIGNEQTAADIMQTVFETLLRKASDLQQKETLGAWLKQCTINACMGYFRQIKQEHLFVENPVHHSQVSQANSDDSDHKEQKQITTLFERLPASSRSVVYLHAVQGLKHNEIAPSIGVEESNSRQLYSRAIKQLKSWLGKADKPL